MKVCWKFIFCIIKTIWLYWFVQSVCGKVDHAVYIQPEQIHISLGESPLEMVITWSTFNATNRSTVWYGIDCLDQIAYGQQTLFTDGGSSKRAMYIHRVYLRKLLPHTTYRYHVGSSQGRSALYTFRTFPIGNQWSPRIVVYGDLGNENSRTMAHLQTLAQTDQSVDMIWHAGDIAYDLHDDERRVGDEFMRQLEPIATYVPYQVCPGNHEAAYNFSHYNNRFTMHSEGSSTPSNFFWSYNVGPAHVIFFTTEFHFYTQYGTEQVWVQHRWLEEDLREANKPENRHKHPWIITVGHRPFYTTNSEDFILRMGNDSMPGFERLFYEAGVDLHLWGHLYIYERLWPVYDNEIRNGSQKEPYTNPKAPVHIITGSAGCISQLIEQPKRTTYSAYALAEYGFTYLNILNQTHLLIQQTSESKNGQVVDDFYLIKEKHGPEAWK